MSAILRREEWHEKNRRLDAAMWERAELSVRISSFQIGQEDISQSDIQEAYDEIKKLHGGHGTYEDYLRRQGAW
jgi:hypothetical protein